MEILYTPDILYQHAQLRAKYIKVILIRSFGVIATFISNSQVFYLFLLKSTRTSSIFRKI